MEIQALARRLIDLAVEMPPINVEVQGFPVDDREISVLEQEYGMDERIRTPAAAIIRELRDALISTEWSAEDMNDRDVPQGNWTFGTAMTVRGPSRTVHGGFLDPVRRIPILTQVPVQVVLYLITIDRGEDYLQNETHSGVGWHYHYLDWRKRRSDVVLCWDTRWITTGPPSKRGLFVEKHADGGKPFKAKPNSWGDRKRGTMYAVCEADLKKRRIDEYRCAADKAEAVYPRNAVLTLRPPNVASAKGNKSPRR